MCLLFSTIWRVFLLTPLLLLVLVEAGHHVDLVPPPVDGGPLGVADRRDGGVAAAGAVRQELHLAVVNAVTSHHHLIITSSHITKSSHDHNHIITHHIITPVCEEVVEVVVPLALSAENVQLPVARMEEHGVAGPRLDPGSWPRDPWDPPDPVSSWISLASFFRCTTDFWTRGGNVVLLFSIVLI